MLLDIITQFFVAIKINQSEIALQDDADNEQIRKLSAKVGVESKDIG